jgi:hypothetical protein
MASVTKSRSTFDHDENQRRVRSPLQLLRKYIRTYVALEGSALVLLFLAAWFWLGLALDYGSFKLFAFDWVQELRDASPQPESSWWIRLFILLALAGVALGLIVTKIVGRCLREFSDANLALVLERRFPRELGDRLITAVESADPAQAKRYGFSQPMVDKTIADAVERLEHLPVAEAFNWARLRRLWLLVGLATLGTFVAAGLLISSVGAATGAPTSFVKDFPEVAGQWGERNLLLRDAYWPRRAYLEVLRFKRTEQDANEMRMGQKHPGLQVRAVRWVIADTAAADGWRPLRWADLPTFIEPSLLAKVRIPADWPYWVVDMDDLDPAVPLDLLPGGWQGKSSGEVRAELENPALAAKIANAGAGKAVEELLDWHGWTVDKVEQQKEKTRQSLRDLGAYTPLEDVFERLAQLTDAAHSRRLRQLEIPESVHVSYRGNKTKGRDSHQRLEGNKFAIGLNDLKESARFRVRGDDYYTPAKRLALVPPPAIAELSVDKQEPAYLYHRLQGDDQTPLRGKVQEIRNYAVSTTGEMSTIEIPLGASLVLHARTDRRLRAPVGIKTPDRADPKQMTDAAYSAQLDSDGKGFTAAFAKVERPLDLTFEYTDEDNIAGQRRIVLQPNVDQPPEVVEVDLDVVLRKPRFKADAGRSAQGTPADGFLITPDALLPFKGTLADDHGLARAGWLHEARQVDIELVGGKDRLPVLILHGNAGQRHAGLVASGLQFWPGNPASALFGPAYLAWMGRFLQFDLAQSAGQGEVFVSLEEFRRIQEAKSLRDIPLTALETLLQADKAPRLVAWSHQLKDEAGFDVKRYLSKLKTTDPARQGQLHYVLRVSVATTDNNVDTGAPHREEDGRTSWGNTTRSKSFFFLVVSENELLAQVALEEEVLFDRLEKVMDKIKAGLTTTEDQVRKLTALDKADPSLIAIRMNEVRGKAVLDAASIAREVTADYNRILREMEVNRVAGSRIAKVREKICFPLDDIVNPNQGDFARAEDAVQKTCQALEDDLAANKPLDKGTHLQNMRETQRRLETVREQLERVLNVMNEGIVESRALEMLITAERTQRRNTETLRLLYNNEAERILRELLEEPQKK